jgi:hypothetical protein
MFTLVMNDVTKDIHGDILQCMLFADDIVLICESKIRVDHKLELWRHFRIERF